jgi:hypothetical protein
MCTIDYDQHAPAWSAGEEFGSEQRVLHFRRVSKKGSCPAAKCNAVQHNVTQNRLFNTRCNAVACAGAWRLFAAVRVPPDALQPS